MMSLLPSLSELALGPYMKLATTLFEAAYIVDPLGTILFWNAAAEQLTGYSSESLVGKKCTDQRLLHINEQGEPCCELGCPIKKALGTNRLFQTSCFLRHKNGHTLPVEIRCLPLHDNSQKILGVLEVFRQKHTKSLAESAVNDLVQTAYIDPITNLPNKQYIEQKIKMLLAESEKAFTEICLSLMIVDIRNLAEFNNHGGLNLGNHLLKEVARTISENIDPEKGSLVARWYGSSFIVFINSNKTPLLLNWANKLKLALNDKTVTGWEGRSIETSLYGTIVQANESFDDITQRLEQHWQECKQNPRNTIIT
ncbi:MAG: sensor domain-containing diguanylate cyclase [Selenomonadaceae bacterium]